MTKIGAMCKVINIGGHKNARQNENKIYRHSVASANGPSSQMSLQWLMSLELGDAGMIECLL